MGRLLRKLLKIIGVDTKLMCQPQNTDVSLVCYLKIQKQVSVHNESLYCFLFSATPLKVAKNVTLY